MPGRLIQPHAGNRFFLDEEETTLMEDHGGKRP
jgi:hypothetical protein